MIEPNFIEILSRHYFSLRGTKPQGIIELSSHGSDRKIIRFTEDESSLIGIYNSHIEENRAFIGFAEHFLKHNLPVPKILKVSDDLHSYILEDLGDLTLFIRLQTSGPVRFNEKNISLYKNVISNLVRFQIEAGPSVNFSLCYQFDTFGEENIRYDLNYFKERFLDSFHKNKYDLSELKHEIEILTHRLLEIPQIYFLYRDCQSRNIMIRDEHPYFIDFQSGRRGALQYDLASLLYDAKAEIPQDIRDLLIVHYMEEAGRMTAIDSNEFMHYFWYFVLVRILQALGAYGFLCIVKGKPKFLESIPYALKNIDYILNHKIDSNEFQYLRKLFSKLENETA